MVSIILFALLSIPLPDSGSLTIRFEGLRSSKGKIYITIFNKSDGYPTKPENAVRKEIINAAYPSVTVNIQGLTAGTYAISAYHDENSNGKLDTNFLGIPVEGTAASNDAKGKFGPPKFDDARFYYDGNDKILKITFQYF